MATNRLGTEGALQLAEGLKNNVNLCRLVLDSNSIGPEGISAICKSLEHHPSLQYLSFGLAKTTRDLGEHANLINDSCAPAIARIISRAPALRVLNLGINDFTSHGLAIIHAAILRSSSLISLRYKQKDRPGAQVLKACSNAHLELNLDGLKQQTGLEGEYKPLYKWHTWSCSIDQMLPTNYRSLTAILDFSINLFKHNTLIAPILSILENWSES